MHTVESYCVCVCVFVYNSHQGNISLYCNLMLCNTFNTTLEIYCNYMHTYCQVCNCLIKDEIVTENCVSFQHAQHSGSSENVTN